MRKIRNISLQDFVLEQVDSFLAIKKETHLGVLLYGIKDSNLSSLLDEEFTNEFEKRGLNIEVVVSENSLKTYPLFSSGTNPLTIDMQGYYTIDISYFLDSSDSEPRFNISR